MNNNPERSAAYGVLALVIILLLPIVWPDSSAPSTVPAHAAGPQIVQVVVTATSNPVWTPRPEQPAAPREAPPVAAQPTVPPTEAPVSPAEAPAPTPVPEVVVVYVPAPATAEPPPPPTSAPEVVVVAAEALAAPVYRRSLPPDCASAADEATLVRCGLSSAEIREALDR